MHKTMLTEEHLSLRLAELGVKVLGGESLTREEARELAAIDHESDAIYELFLWANKIRIKHNGRAVKFCSIVTGKVGGCSEDCSYCSQSKHYQTHVKPSAMRVTEMEDAAQEALKSGASSFGIVNSGRGPTDRELDWMEPFFKKAAEEGKIRPCATLGELSLEKAQRLKAMGVERINHNIESSESHFGEICSTHSWQSRLDTIRNAKAAGLSICSGGIFGLGESWEDRLDMAFTLQEVGVDVVPINFLYPIEGTPLYEKQQPMQPLEALKIVAIFRFLLPDKELKVAGGREKVLRDLQSWIFFAGGSSFLIGNYLTTFGRTPQQDHQLLADLCLGYRTYHEAEVEADPGSVPGAGPGAFGVAGEAATLMQRKRGGVVALNVMGQAPAGAGCCGK